MNRIGLTNTAITIPSPLSVGDIEALVAQFGTPPNYTEFESDGTMVARGSASTWRDELQSLASARLLSPAGDIVLNPSEASITFKSSARYPTDFAMVNHQINHDWELGTNIHPHLHWWQTSVATPNWMIEYRWQKQGSAKTTGWTPIPWSSNFVVWTAGTLNQITEFPPIVPPVGYGEVSDILQFLIYRDVTNVNFLFAGAEVGPVDQDAVNFDSHIETDTLGSRTEYTK